jgi:uncharacterized membrane protein YcaP (DUF421 family)
MTELLNQVHDFLRPLLGLGEDPKNLGALQVSLRGLIVFLAAIAIVRVADKRFLSRKTAFDVVLGLILASVLARAVNGSARIIPTLVCGFVLALAHRFLAYLSLKSHRIGNLVKGHDETVIENGRIVEESLRKHNFTHRDLMEDLRLDGVRSPGEVESARIERNGDLSVVKKQKHN